MYIHVHTRPVHGRNTLRTHLCSDPHLPTLSPSPQQSPPKYQFEWAVNDPPSGNDYGQQEGRDGYDPQGSYFVQLPDGRLQRVDYTVSGDSGFVAQVTYEGEAQFPKQNGGYGKPQPSYGPPKKSYGPPSK